MRYQTPLRGLKRFKSQKEISIKLHRTWARLDYKHVRELISYLQDMLDGDLIEVNVQPCGCLKSERKPK